MRLFFATVTSFAILIVGWATMAVSLGLVLSLTAKALGGAGVLHLLSLFIIWILAPAYGGFSAVFMTGKIFKGVVSQNILVGLMSSIFTLYVVLTGILMIVDKDWNLGGFLLTSAQVASIFAGAIIARNWIGVESN